MLCYTISIFSTARSLELLDEATEAMAENKGLYGNDQSANSYGDLSKIPYMATTSSSRSAQDQNQKIVRVRSGCWTCKARYVLHRDISKLRICQARISLTFDRRRKCDEAKPFCMNCVKNSRQCEGYNIRLSFDVDDSRHTASGVHFDVKGRPVVGFRRRPRLKESMTIRDSGGASFVETSGAATVPEEAAQPVPVKELKFVVHSYMDGSRRRKNKSETELGSQVKKPKKEESAELLLSNSSGLSWSLSPASSVEPTIGKLDQFSEYPEQIKQEGNAEEDVIGFVNMSSNGVRINALRPSTAEGANTRPGLPVTQYASSENLWRNVRPEEQELLQYYFTELSPLLDNLKNSNLVGLAITFCSHELVLSSFLCLASVHLASKLKNEIYYALGLEYHSRTIKYLGNILNAVSQRASLDKSSQAMQTHIPVTKVGRGHGIAVLIVIYFLITFEIFDNGKSSTVRSHLAAFSSIIKDRELAADVLAAPNGMYLFRVFAWYDTLTAACSKDSRALLVTGSYFFPLDAEDSGLEGLMGCPDDIMLAIRDIVQLRSEMKYNRISLAEIQSSASNIETRIRNYRSVKKWDGRESYDYVQHLTASQCWAQAATIFLFRSTGMDPSNQRIAKSVYESMRLLKTMEVGTDADRHMIWPLLVIGCELKDEVDRNWFSNRIGQLFSVTHCETLKTLNGLLSEVWQKNTHWEAVINNDAWKNFDFLAL